ncbi:hypothetical protein CEUSTIGMA_g10698.t1 [Chlamydomonas eustigma]|uniref:DUF2470 domain-containing protein n=1 Tax=Chlamydomonas eustigma TaxID=1157962 RepID=A0A250XK28_9CHLO|nr:hypothetical protein CEUSTIGMA_g10698.t1 [Chlamydomonas eustigma]|eukprot:GAX83272.1 hypothetical protein CEUSTIGMA_g10698.t1 [Chlamydomonas eustigma]
MMSDKVLRHPKASSRIHCAPSIIFRRSLVAREATNKPSPAETARTIVSIVGDGTLSTLSPDGAPIGTPVSYTLDKEGSTWVNLPAHAPEIQYLKANSRCSLLVKPQSLPARAVASVSLVGRISVTDPGSHHNNAGAQEASPPSPSSSLSAPSSSFRMNLDKALYFGGLDESLHMHEVSASEYLSAEPDVLRNTAAELVKLWNEERAEDVYRIVSQAVKVPLSQMLYAELLWVDRLGLYISCEKEGGESKVVRVPFIRPVLDERDARSAITMAAQIAWEEERPYTPAPPTTSLTAVNN